MEMDVGDHKVVMIVDLFIHSNGPPGYIIMNVYNRSSRLFSGLL